MNKDEESVSATAAVLAKMSKGEMKKLLKALEESAKPETQVGAMCYMPAPWSSRAEYVCPICGEKTLYLEDMARVVDEELGTCRRLLRSMPHHEAMMLDESTFCRKCRPEGIEPKLALTIRYDDGTTNVVSGVSSDDLKLLKAALKGESYIDGPGVQRIVNDELSRLRTLLGVNE